MFQKILLSIVLFFAVGIVAFFLLIKVIDFNEYKPRIQKAIKENTGYEIIIRGDITLSLSPVGVSIFDVEVTNPTYHPEAPFAKLGSFDVALDLSALLNKEVKVRHISIDNLNLLVEKTKEGTFNYQLPPPLQKEIDKKTKVTNVILDKDEDSHLLVNVKKMKFSNANITYIEASTNTKMVFEKINLDLNDISYDTTKNTLQGLSLIAEMNIQKLQYANIYTVKDLSMSLEMKDAIAVTENLQFTMFDTLILGNGKFDLSGKQPKISLKSKISDLKLSSLSKELWNSDLIEGNANGDVRLSFFIGDPHMFKSTLNGYAQLSGKDITLKGYDIDKIALILDPNNKSKNLNLNTIFSWTSERFKGGKTLIKEVNTKFDIGYSEVQLSDVAFSTASSRVALKGAVNIVDEKFLNVETALLNSKGCATFEQKFSGTFAKPSIKVDEAAITTLTNVILTFTTRSKKKTLVPEQDDANCTVFYDGVVKHPELNPVE